MTQELITTNIINEINNIYAYKTETNLHNITSIVFLKFLTEDNWLDKTNNYKTLLKTKEKNIEDKKLEIYKAITNKNSNLENTFDRGKAKGNKKYLIKQINKIKDIPKLNNKILENFAEFNQTNTHHPKPEITQIMTEIIAHHFKPNETPHILDTECGDGTLLIETYKKLNPKTTIFAESNNTELIKIAKMNGIINKIFLCDAEFEYARIDENKHKINETQKINAIITAPQQDRRWQHKNTTKYWPELRNYTLPPEHSMNLLHILHGIHTLTKNGIMAIALSKGMLFREGPEQEIREQLIKENLIDTIITLPQNMLAATRISSCIIILKKNRTTKDILVIESDKTNTNTIIDKYKERNKKYCHKDIKKIIQKFRM